MTLPTLAGQALGITLCGGTADGAAFGEALSRE